jgi:hypothetical protein
MDGGLIIKLPVGPLVPGTVTGTSAERSMHLFAEKLLLRLSYIVTNHYKW